MLMLTSSTIELFALLEFCCICDGGFGNVELATLLRVVAAAISELGDRLLFPCSFALECCEVDNEVKDGDGHISFV